MEQETSRFLGEEPVGRLMRKYAMGKAIQSTILSMTREIVFGVGFALLLPLFFGLDGVLYSMPLSDILTFAVAAFLILRTYKQLGA